MFEQDDQDALFPGVKGDHHPVEQILLCRYLCASSGDTFVKMMKDFQESNSYRASNAWYFRPPNCCKVDDDDFWCSNFSLVGYR